MSKERNQMIKSIKEFVVPKLKDIHFLGSFPHFRRTIGDKTNLITFQFDRNGGGFVIEIANFCGEEFRTVWNEVIPLNKLKAHDLGDKERQRIYPDELIEKSGVDCWFRYDKKSFLSFGNKYDKLSKKVIARFSLMEEYWNKN